MATFLDKSPCRANGSNVICRPGHPGRQPLAGLDGPTPARSAAVDAAPTQCGARGGGGLVDRADARPTQMLTAGALAWCWRINLPVALATTLYTNPLTIVPLYWLAYEYGCLLTGQQGGSASAAARVGYAGIWRLAGANGRLGANPGLAIIAGVLTGLTLGLAGHGLVMLAWRWHTVHAWRHRRHLQGKHHMALTEHTLIRNNCSKAAFARVSGSRAPARWQRGGASTSPTPARWRFCR